MIDQKKVSLQSLLSLIPEDLLSTLSKETNVNYYSKVLYGERMFNLLLYGLLMTDRTSQRTLADIFSNELFKNLFCYEAGLKVSRSSISTRLAKIDTEFFRLSYERVYAEFNKWFTPQEQLKHKVVRVDSTMVAETCNKLQKGLSPGKKSESGGSRVQQIKYTMGFDGLSVCALEIFSDKSYTSENKAIPELIVKHAHKEGSVSNLYVFDRGVSDTKAYNSFDENQILFVGRLKTNRIYTIVKDDQIGSGETDLGELNLISSRLIHFHPCGQRKADTSHLYRLIIAERKEKVDTTPRNNKGNYRKKENEFWFITNDLSLTPQEITDIYRQRWDIEVFFRFIKQELNASHFLSVSENGITVVLYMTLITAMLLLMYKKLNDIGYKTAKRRMTMDITTLLVKVIVKECGGDPAQMKNVHLRNIRLP